MRRWVLLAAMLAAPTVAGAHHETGVTRVDGMFSGSLLGLARGGGGPRLELGLGVDAARFGKVLRGTDRLRDTSGRVAITSTVPSAALWTDDRTRLAVDLPLGAVSRRGVQGWQTELGVGDLRLGALRRVDIGPDERPTTLLFEGSLSAPTGHYARHASVTAEDVSGGADGALLLTTYDTRASLGAGATLASVRASALHPLGRVTATGGLGARAPLHATRDGVRWGWDLDASAGAQLALGSGRTLLRGELDARRHTADGTAVPEPGETASGRRVGARSAVGLSAGVLHRLDEKTTCAAQVRAPAWQRVQGIQLAETWSATVRCAVTWGLARDRDEAG